MRSVYLHNGLNPYRVSIFGLQVSASQCLLLAHLSSVALGFVVLQALFSYFPGLWLWPPASICWDALGLYGALISLTAFVSVFQSICNPDHGRLLSRALYVMSSKLTRPLRLPAFLNTPMQL